MTSKSRYARAAASIKKELAAEYPGIKFSVRSKSYSMGNHVYVSWDMGPTTKEVDSIISKYQEGSFNGMTDSYEYDRDVESEAFRAEHGSTKYVSGFRRLSDGLFERVCRDIAELQGVEFTHTWQRRENDSLGLDDYAHRVLDRTSFPAGAEYVGVKYSEKLTLCGACAADEVYTIVHTLTDPDEEIRAAIKAEFDYIKQQVAA